jgi:Ala-tRNA(Pro) deacylase
MNQVFKAITTLLDNNNITYKHLHHEPTPTSEDSARIRKEPVEIGGKALVLKIEDDLKLFVVSGAKKLNTKAIKKHFNIKKIRFATKEELYARTKLIPGSVPPFGKPILDLELYLDESILENEKIAFNAGLVTDSIIMKTQDYKNVAKPIVFSFSK